MNHYLNTHLTQLFFIQIFILIGLLSSFFFLTLALTNKFVVSETISKIIIVGTSFVIMVFVFGGTKLFRDHYNYGKINKLYVISTGNKSCLTVLLSQKKHGRFGISHTPVLASFDLNNGHCFGTVYPSNKAPADDYRIYESPGQKAWGNSYKTGVQLLDLVTPQVLAGQKEIVKKNPQLGGNFRLVSIDYFYDPVTHSIQVMTKDGRYFRITGDLKATRINNYARRTPHQGWQINVYQLSDQDKKEKVIAALSRDNEILVFVSRGGYTLAALRKNPVTGEMLGRIEYFN